MEVCFVIVQAAQPLGRIAAGDGDQGSMAADKSGLGCRSDFSRSRGRGHPQDSLRDGGATN